MPPDDPPDWPEYCCAILRDARGRYLLDRRPPDSKAAPGQLTCFGGKREPGEAPEACVARELREELGFECARLDLCVQLIGRPREGPDRAIAWFFRGVAPSPDTIRTEPGHAAEWVEPESLPAAAIGRWNRPALEAERKGEPIAVIPVDP